MPTNAQNLFPASFRGVPFFVEEESLPNLGQKTAIHDYPNSGKRYVQPLGPNVKTFSLKSKVKGLNYKQDALNLEEALNDPSHGKLVSPNFGAINVKALAYPKTFNFKEIGVISYTLTFSVSNADEDPGLAQASVEDIFQAGDESRLLMQTKFVENYEVPKSRIDILTMTEDFLDAVNDTIDKYTRVTVFDTSRLQNILFDVNNTINRLIRLPDELAKKLIYGNLHALDALFATIASLFTDPDNDSSSKPSASTALELSNFGEDLKNNGTEATTSGIPLWPEDTANRILRNQNRIITVESVRLNSLVLAFEVAANFDYQVSTEIENVIIELETVYADLILIGDPSNIFANDEDIKLSIDTVKELAYNVLEQKAQQVYSVTELKFQGVNSVVGMAYKLYQERLENPADLEEVAELINGLNPIQTPLEMTGEVSAFES